MVQQNVFERIGVSEFLSVYNTRNVRVFLRNNMSQKVQALQLDRGCLHLNDLKQLDLKGLQAKVQHRAVDLRLFRCKCFESLVQLEISVYPQYKTDFESLEGCRQCKYLKIQWVSKGLRFIQHLKQLKEAEIGVLTQLNVDELVYLQNRRFKPSIHVNE